MKNIDRSLFRSLKNYQKMKVEKKERESDFLNINADINNVNIYEDSKIDIYNEKELERKIKLTKWVQFKNEGYNNVFNKDASRQNTKIIFSFLGFLACIIVFIMSIFYTLGEHTHAIKREIYTQIVMSVIFGMTFLISAIKLIHYKLTDVWVKRDAVIINLDTNCSNNKNVRIKMLIRDNIESYELEVDVDKTNILCAVSDYDRVMIAKPTEKSNDVYIIANLDAEQRKNDNLQILNSIKRK